MMDQFVPLISCCFLCLQIMRRLLDQFNSSNSTMEQRLSILQELEYLVHQVARHIPHKLTACYHVNLHVGVCFR